MSLNYKSPHITKIKDELLRISQVHWEAREVKKKSGPKTAADEAKEHASSAAEYKAILAKKSGYAQRAHDYLENDGDRNAVYHDFPHVDQVFDSGTAKVFREKAKFPGDVKANFNPKAKHKTELALQKFPYSWRAHHLIPGSAFYAEGDDGPIVTDDHRKIIKQTDYDVNHGHNIINLPAKNSDVPIHSLIQHPSDHMSYTKSVMEAMADLAADIQEKIDNSDKPHEDLIIDCFSDLQGLEDSCWKKIVKLSRASVTKVLNDAQLASDNVKYESSSGNTSYKWGALC